VNKYANFYFLKINQKLAENPANHGFIFSPLKRVFGRPNGISDYAYRKMQERGNLASSMLPDVIASNPIMGMFGNLGKNRFAQYFIDKYLSPGGSYADAYMKTLGSFGNKLVGPGIKNLPQASTASANFLKNINKAFTGSDGLWDYKKSYGYTRDQVLDNLAAYNKQFGGVL
jgi:hypothetical protein